MHESHLLSGIVLESLECGHHPGLTTCTWFILLPNILQGILSIYIAPISSLRGWLPWFAMYSLCTVLLGVNDR